eukprot:361304-Chlamydomonas_euryale.AAC.4
MQQVHMWKAPPPAAPAPHTHSGAVAASATLQQTAELAPTPPLMDPSPRAAEATAAAECTTCADASSQHSSCAVVGGIGGSSSGGGGSSDRSSDASTEARGMLYLGNPRLVLTAVMQGAFSRKSIRGSFQSGSLGSQPPEDLPGLLRQASTEEERGTSLLRSSLAS